MRTALTAFALLLGLGMASPANAQINWTGSAGWRYVLRELNDGLSAKDSANKDTSKQTVKTHQQRFDLNAAEKGDHLDWGIGVRSFSSATSEWLTFSNNLDLAVNLENAYLRFHHALPGSEGSVQIGRGKTVLLYDSIGQALFDKDNRFDGFGWSWKMENFGLNLAQYVLGARNAGTFGSSSLSRTEATENVAATQSGFGVLYSFQPHIKFKVSDEVEGTFAVAYHVWSGVQGNGTSPAFTNPVHGGTAAPTTAANLTGDERAAIVMSNPRQWQFYTEWNLPMKLRFVGEFVQNKKVYYGGNTIPQTARKANSSALALSLVYGKVKVKNDWAVSYSFVRKGIASSINTFSHGNMPADNTGHLFDAKYALADGLTLGAKVEIFRELAKLGGDGLALTGTGAGRKQSQDRYELITGMAF